MVPIMAVGGEDEVELRSRRSIEDVCSPGEVEEDAPVGCSHGDQAVLDVDGIAEVAAQIQEEAFDYLDAPVGRLAAPFSPVPFSPALEAHYLPSAKSIEQAIRDIVARPGA